MYVFAKKLSLLQSCCVFEDYSESDKGRTLNNELYTLMNTFTYFIHMNLCIYELLR